MNPEPTPNVGFGGVDTSTWMTSLLSIFLTVPTTTSTTDQNGNNTAAVVGGPRYEYMMAALSILFLTWVVTFVKQKLIELVDSIRSRFYYTARLSYPDSMYMNFLEWLGSQDVLYGTKGVSISTRYFEGGTEDESLNLKYLPTGVQWIRFKGYFVSVSRTSSEKSGLDGLKEDYLDLTVFGGTKKLITEMMNVAIEYSTTMTKDKTKIYSLDSSCTYWECICIQNKRVLDSVFLEENVRSTILNDLDKFVNGKEWYLNTGVPYRRGYLLYGPPGSGKTSFILSMAGKFGKSISIMNMAKGVHDGNINGIIQKCPKNTILVLEDIDAAFVKRSSNQESLTFSSLLNAIDGLASSDGRILMMTTNYIERLSPALIRPGRIDLKVHLGFATPHQVELMYQRFFSEEYHHQVKDIIDRIKDDKISTAQLQGWFIIHRDDPDHLLETVDDFLESCRLELKNNDIITASMKDKEVKLNGKKKKNDSDLEFEHDGANIKKEGEEEEEEQEEEEREKDLEIEKESDTIYLNGNSSIIKRRVKINDS
ncbi:hypothetical protein CYY_001200 [Polysphondylium violaceum]|uniref:AAA ATPase domain-containing protein n=1 Tax=Polysphondylium violaceum TaxID=133409 RepID=A0A8J4Q9P3_9MYCE|nr:hypothetical protein CYY_001200 [Polysphondylium violaceum]